MERMVCIENSTGNYDLVLLTYPRMIQGLDSKDSVTENKSVTLLRFSHVHILTK